MADIPLDEINRANASSGMDELFRQIEVAADNGLYYLALVGTLIVPDICGGLESMTGEASGPSYIAWFDARVAPLHRGFLNGTDCYRFRCSLLHQGRTQHPQGGYERILFLEPGSGVTLHMCRMNDALAIDVRTFAHEMVNAAVAWRSSVSGSEPYESNIARFVSRYPRGFVPFVVGAPVIT